MGPPGAKKQKTENNIKERLAAKLDAPSEAKLSINKANLKYGQKLAFLHLFTFE